MGVILGIMENKLKLLIIGYIGIIGLYWDC